MYVLRNVSISFRFSNLAEYRFLKYILINPYMSFLFLYYILILIFPFIYLNYKLKYNLYLLYIKIVLFILNIQLYLYLTYCSLKYILMYFLSVCCYFPLFISSFFNLDLIFPPLINLDKSLSILLLFAKNQLFVLQIICVLLLLLFVCFCFTNFSPEFDYFLLSILLGIIPFFVFRCTVKLLVFDISIFFVGIQCYDLASQNHLHVLHKIGYIVYSFSFNFRTSSICLLVSILTHKLNFHFL